MTIASLGYPQAIPAVGAGMLPRNDAQVGGKPLCRREAPEIPYLHQYRQRSRTLYAQEAGQLIDRFPVDVALGKRFDALVLAVDGFHEVLQLDQVAVQHLLVYAFQL